MRIFMTLIMFCTTMLSIASGNTDKQDKLNERIQELRQTLVSRRSPALMLNPSLDDQSRADESGKVMRPYLSLQFEYNLADLRWKGEDAAQLPVRVRWETPRMEGSLSGTIRMVRVAGEWYFLSFDFLLFPWWEVILAGSVATAFTVGIFWLVRKLKQRRVPRTQS